MHRAKILFCEKSMGGMNERQAQNKNYLYLPTKQQIKKVAG